MEEKVLTFLLSNPDNPTFTPELYSNCRNFVNDASVVVLHEFNHFYNCIFKYANDDFTFRLLVHSGSADKGSVMTSGDNICQEIRGKAEFVNVDISFITRKPDWFEKDQYFTFRDGAKYWNMKYFNSDAAINQFLAETRPIRKGDLKISITNETTKNQISTTAKQKIFIGSSSVGLPYAESVKSALEKKIKNDKTTKGKYDVDIWNTVFDDNKTTIEKLEEIINKYKYSIFIFSPDDKIKMSGSKHEKDIPRDNVIFEYGLFMGKSGRPNTFPIVPDNWKDLRILSDINGLFLYQYTDNEKKDSAVGTPVKDIFDNIKKLDITLIHIKK